MYVCIYIYIYVYVFLFICLRGLGEIEEMREQVAWVRFVLKGREGGGVFSSEEGMGRGGRCWGPGGAGFCGEGGGGLICFFSGHQVSLSFLEQPRASVITAGFSYRGLRSGLAESFKKVSQFLSEQLSLWWIPEPKFCYPPLRLGCQHQIPKPLLLLVVWVYTAALGFRRRDKFLLRRLLLESQDPFRMRALPFKSCHSWFISRADES